MSIKKLGNNIQSRLNSAAKIHNYKSVVEELVYNSLDSESTSIAIRIDINESFIQVIDNGTGISSHDISLLGQRYATSKGGDVVRESNKHGSRGESLANIIDVSESVQITSRIQKSEETWRKCFYKGNHKNSFLTTMRPSKGTTVEVKGFLFNLKIQKREINHVYEIQNIKTFLQQISLVRTNVSISLRNNTVNEIIFKIHKNRDIYQTLTSLFEIEKLEIQELQVEKYKYKIQGFVGKQTAVLNSIKWIYLNEKIIYNSILHSIIDKYFTKTLRKRRRINNSSQDMLNYLQNVSYYFIFISCPNSDYEIYFEPETTILEFKDWNQMKLLVEKFVKFYTGDLIVKEVKGSQLDKIKALGNTEEAVKEIVEKILGNDKHPVKISQMHKGVKGKTIRKKPKLIEDKRVKKNVNEQTGNHISIKDQCSKLPQLDKRVQSKIVEEPLRESYEILTKINELETVKKEGIKEVKIKKKKFKDCSDPLIKKFIIETDSVKRRCNVYSKNMKALLIERKNTGLKIDKVINNDDDISLEDNTNYKIPKCHRKYYANSNVGNFIEKERNDVNVMPLVKTNKRYLKSYDLLKTILNTQELSTCTRNIENTDSSHKKNNTHDHSNQIKAVNDLEDVSCLNAEVKTNTFMELTYNSHKFDVNNCSKNNAEQNKPKHLNQFDARSELTHSLALNRKFEDKHVNHQSSYFTQSCYAKSKCQNIIKSDDYINEEKSLQFSHVDNTQCFIESTNGYSLDIWNYNFSGKIQSTYTVTDRNPPINIKNYIVQTDNVNKSQSYICFDQCYTPTPNCLHNPNYTDNDMCIHKLSENKGSSNKIFKSHPKNVCEKVVESEVISNSTFEPLNGCETLHRNDGTKKEQANVFKKSKGNNDIRSKSIDIKKQETSLNFHKANNRIVQSPESESQKDNNLEIVAPVVTLHRSCSIDPLNLCEAVYQMDENNRTKWNTLTREEGSITRSIPHSKHDNNSNIEFNMYDIEMDDVSRHLRYPSTLDLKSWKVNYDENVPTKAQESFDNMCNINSLDICFETISEWERIVSRNEECKNFTIQNRNNLLPKGTSQLLVNYKSKKLCSYNLEADYFQDDLYNDFADSVLDKYNLFEARIQGVNENEILALKSSKLKKNSLKFNADSLSKAKVFGQVDNKYIAAQLQSEDNSEVKYLVLFDQHAVHERIRLEENLADYIKDERWISVDCETLSVKLPKEYLMYISNFREKFTRLGLKWTFEKDTILINAMPKAILGKNCRETNVVINFITKLLIEEIKALRFLRGNALLYPRSIMELVFSEACRYAIKFGDKLDNDKCAMLVKSLSSCKTPFQCAHGRPVMAVLLDVKTIDNKYKVDMSKILLLRNKLFM